MNKQAEKNNFWHELGNRIICFGFVIFCFTYWIPDGFIIGGNPLYLGKFNPELEIQLPYSILGITLVMLGSLLLKSFRASKGQWIIFFTFLIGNLLLSIIVINSKETLLTSILSDPSNALLFLIIWGVAFWGMGFFHAFHLQGKFKNLIWALGILTGILSSFLFDIPVSRELLAIAAILGAFFIRLETRLKVQMFIILFYTWVVFESHNLGLVFLFLATWMGADYWLPRSAKIKNEWMLLLPVIFSFLLFFDPRYDFVFPTFNSIKSVGGNMFWGVGDGRYLIALQQNAEVFLTPKELIKPSYGIVLTYFEKGVFGVILTGMLMVYPYLFRKKYGKLLTFLFSGFWIFSPVLVGSEIGILFLGMMIFGRDKMEIEKRM